MKNLIFLIIAGVLLTGCDNEVLYKYGDIQNCVLEKHTPKFMSFNMDNLSFKKNEIEYSFKGSSKKTIPSNLEECEGISYFQKSIFFLYDEQLEITESFVLKNGKDESIQIIKRCFEKGLEAIKNSNTEEYLKLEKLSTPLLQPCETNIFQTQCK